MVCGRVAMRCRVLLTLVVLALGCVPVQVAGQERLVITGTVQWIDGQKMEVMADDGLSIRVDLERVDQSSYNTLSGGDRVRVVGFVSPDRSKLIAESVEGGATNVYDK
jgi:hypothetical protein